MSRARLTASRRAVLAMGATVAGGAVAPAAFGAATARTPFVLYDPAEPAACAFAAEAAARGGRCLPLEADRVQLARLVFGEHRPDRVRGMTRYADFLLLTESAREAGYSLGPIARRPDDLFAWSLERRLAAEKNF